jgi:biotin carboxylase
MIVVASRLPPSLLPYHLWLHDAPDDVVLIAHGKRFAAEPVPDAFWVRFAQVFLLDDYDDSGRLESIVFKLHAERPIRQIVAVSEFDLFRVAKVRHALAIDGQRPDSAAAYRDKAVMKRRLKDAGIQVAPFRAVEAATDILSFVEEHGPQVVLKPRSGTGAVDTAIMTTPAEVYDLVERLPRVAEGLDLDLIVESFIKGDLYHIDGLQIDDRVVLSWPSLYTVDPVATKTVGYDGSYMLAPEHPLRRRLQTIVAQTLTALPTPATTAFHAEVFHTPDDRLVLCEVASRVGSWPTNDMVLRAFDVDITRWWVRSICGLPDEIDRRSIPDVPRRYTGFFALLHRPGRFLGIPHSAMQDWMSSCLIEVRPGDVLGVPKSTSDRIIQCIVTGDTPEEVALRLKEASRIFRVFVVPLAEDSEPRRAAAV